MRTLELDRAIRARVRSEAREAPGGCCRHGAGGDQPMFATTRRAVLRVPLAILFAVVQWATVPARAADPIKVGFSMALTRALRRSR
jgi:hypothetical protein